VRADFGVILLYLCLAEFDLYVGDDFVSIIHLDVESRREAISRLTESK
jgi:hypothetical protein